MSVWTRSSTGAFVSGTSVSTVSPATPSWATGDLGLIACGIHFNDTTLNTPTGWTALYTGTYATRMQLFGRIIQPSDTCPSITTAASTSNLWAYPFSYGGAPTTVTGIVDSMNEKQVANATLSLTPTNSSFTPVAQGCLIIYVSARDKTATSNNAVYSSSPTNMSLVAYQTTAGATTAHGIADWIQTTAVTVDTTAISCTGTADSSNTGSAFKIALIPGSGGGGGGQGLPTTFPPTQRRKYITYDYFYPR